MLPKAESLRMQKNIADAVAKKDTLNVFSELTSLEGNRIYLEERYFPTWEEDAAIHVNILTRDITVSKIFEKKITGLANDLRSLIDQANAVIIGTDTRGYITDWNRHTRMLTGYTKNDALAHKFTSLLMGEPDREIFEEIFSQVLDGKPVMNAEIPILNKDGQKLIFLVSATARFNALNQITGIVFVGQDITLRLKVEQEFKFAHERLLFHMENAPLGFIEWDNQLRAKSWTKRAEEIFGWTQQEFSNSGRTGYSQVYDEDLPWVSKISDDLLNGRIERNQVLHRNVRKDGSVIWCEWFNSVLKDDQGKVITLMSLVQDVTERKKNEIRLQEAQAIAHLGNWEMELKSQKVTWSQETFNILGYQAGEQEPSLKAYLDVVHPADRERVESIIGLRPQAHAPQPFSHRIIRDGKRAYPVH